MLLCFTTFFTFTKHLQEQSSSRDTSKIERCFFVVVFFLLQFYKLESGGERD